MSGKENIAVIANSQVSYQSMGGSDKIFLELSRAWLKLGRTVSILGCREAGKMCAEAGLRNNFKEISGFDVMHFSLFGAYLLRTISACFKKKIQEEGVLYSSSDFWPDIFYAFRQKCLDRDVKWIAGLYLIAPNPFKVKYARSLRGIIYWLSQKAAIGLIKNKADLAVVLCEKDKEFLLLRGFDKNRIVVISGGVDLETIDKVPQGGKIYDACFLGRFHEQKGIPELILIWKAVVEKFPAAKLAIVGWGNDYWLKKIRALIAQNSLEKNVVLKGFLDNDDKYRVLKQSKVFMFTSSYESWGIVVAEALGCAVPVVAFDIPAIRKFGQAVLSVKNYDINDFAFKVVSLLNDDNLLINYANMCRASVRDLSWVNSAAKLLIMQKTI